MAYLAAVVITLRYLHSAVLLASLFYIDIKATLDYNKRKIKSFYTQYCNKLKLNKIYHKGGYRTLQFILWFVYTVIVYKDSFGLFVLYIDTVILVHHLKC